MQVWLENPDEEGLEPETRSWRDRSSSLNLRDKIWCALESPCSTAAGRIYGKAMFFCIVVSEMSILLQSLSELSGVHPLVWTAIDAFCAIVFTLEFIARFAICPSKSKFFLGWLNWIDIVSILSFYLESMFEKLFLIRSDSGFSEEFFRLLRVPRILLLRRYSQPLWLIHRTLYNSRVMLFLLGSLTLVVALLFATLGYVFEHAAQPAVFGNITESLWWAVITLTTTGFGDIQPVTVMGQITAGILMLVGTVIVRLPISMLGIACVRVFTIHRRRTVRRSLANNSDRFSMTAILQDQMEKSISNLLKLDKSDTPTQTPSGPHHHVAMSPEFQLGQHLSCELKPGIRSKFAKLRKLVWQTWENPRDSTAGVCYQVLILVAVTLCTAALITESVDRFRHHTTAGFDIINDVSSTVLTLDVALRIFFLESPKTLVTDWQTVCQIVASTPFVLNRLCNLSLPSMSIFSTLRLMRVFRLTPSDMSRKVSTIRMTVSQSLSVFAMLFLAVGSISIIGAFVAFEFEMHNSKSSISECFYWAIQAITTVGYGDVVLTATGSKIVGSMLTIGGGISIALPVAILSDTFTENLESTGGVETQARRLSRATNSALNVRLIEFHRDMLGFHAFLHSKYPDLVQSKLVSEFRLRRHDSTATRLLRSSPSNARIRFLSPKFTSSPVMMDKKLLLRKMVSENFNLIIKREALQATMSKTTLHIHRLLRMNRQQQMVNHQTWKRKEKGRRQSCQKTEEPECKIEDWDQSMSGSDLDTKDDVSSVGEDSTSAKLKFHSTAVPLYSPVSTSSAAVVWMINEELDEVETQSSTRMNEQSFSTEFTFQGSFEVSDLKSSTTLSGSIPERTAAPPQHRLIRRQSTNLHRRRYSCGAKREQSFG
eukprot:c32336_g1_i1.p1 GENE.c32336_g1_i1~~c32336_g1_i1.p1  ORF type:complete len:882 (+),score=162.99 c32336_g1_i1:116-2761(+)